MLSITINACQEECKTKCGQGKGINHIAYMMHNFGQALEDVPVPVFDKLGNILPFAVIAFSLKKFPKQVLAACGLSLLYYMYQTNAIRKLLKRDNKVRSVKKAVSKQSTFTEFEDSFFNIDDEPNDGPFISKEQKGRDNVFSMHSHKSDTTQQPISFL
jgi:hypothetical protein